MKKYFDVELTYNSNAIDYIEDIVSKNIDISERVIKDLHYIILKSIDDFVKIIAEQLIEV